MAATISSSLVRLARLRPKSHVADFHPPSIASITRKPYSGVSECVRVLSARSRRTCIHDAPLLQSPPLQYSHDPSAECVLSIAGIHGLAGPDLPVELPGRGGGQPAPPEIFPSSPPIPMPNVPPLTPPEVPPPSPPPEAVPIPPPGAPTPTLPPNLPLFPPPEVPSPPPPGIVPEIPEIPNPPERAPEIPEVPTPPDVLPDIPGIPGPPHVPDAPELPHLPPEVPPGSPGGRDGIMWATMARPR
ncbi:hypothetical protein CLOP_g16320 [Closterium sp. NIES-67]|nr:hypothetical protein CLOP_g16320 [Closterium sp. NIES-67]